MRTVIRLAAVAAFAAVAVAGTASVAYAHSGSETVGVVKRADTMSYLLPTATSTPVHVGLQPDTKVLINCWAEGQQVSGNPLWWRIAVNGRIGFVPVDTVHAMQPQVPACAMG